MSDIITTEDERKKKELQAAFEFFEAAARNRYTEPEIYEGARIRYMALKEGPGWLELEKKKVQAEKLEPEIDKYRQQYDMLKSEVDVQKGYTDSIANIRIKQSALKESANGTIDFLGNLLEEKEAKLSAYNRYIELTTPAPVATTQQIASQQIPLVSYFAGFPASFLTVLDVILAIMILCVLYLAYYKGSDAIHYMRFGSTTLR
jgi:hypothetical protein